MKQPITNIMPTPMGFLEWYHDLALSDDRDAVKILYDVDTIADLLSKPISEVLIRGEEPNWENYVIGYHEMSDEYELDKKYESDYDRYQNFQPLFEGEFKKGKYQSFQYMDEVFHLSKYGTCSWMNYEGYFQRIGTTVNDFVHFCHSNDIELKFNPKFEI